MQSSGGGHLLRESAIFQELSLYKIIKADGKNIITHMDGSVSAIIRLRGRNPTAFVEQDFERIFSVIKRAIDNLHEGVNIQLLTTRSRNKNVVDPTKLPTYLAPRADLFNRYSENFRVFDQEIYLSVLVFHPKKSSVNLIRDFIKQFGTEDKRLENLEKAMVGIEDRVDLLLQTCESLINSFDSAGFAGLMLDSKQDYYDLIQRFTRPGKSQNGSIEIDDRSESPRQVLFSGVRATTRKQDFALDNHFHRVYSLDRVPKDYLYGRTVDVLKNIPYEYLYSITFKKLSHTETLNKFKMKLFEKRVNTGKNENAVVEDKFVEAEAKRVEQEYDLFAYGSGVGIAASVNLVLRISNEVLESEAESIGKTPSEFIRKLDTQLSRDLFPRFGNSDWVAEDNTQWLTFNKLIPGFSEVCSDVLKTSFLSSDNIPYFFSIWDKKRDIPHDGTNHFYDEQGNFVTFNLLDPNLPAWNYSISGQTGSGKSVLVNTILTMQFAEAAKRKKPVVCIIDASGDVGSYTKIVKLAGGEFINLSSVKKPHIQMFEINPNDSMPTPDKVKQISKELFKRGIGKNEDDLEIQVRNYFLSTFDSGIANMTKLDRYELFQTCFGAIASEELLQLFELKTGECEPFGKSLIMLMGIFEIILSNNAKDVDGFSSFAQDEVQSMILNVYRSTPGRFPTMTDFYNMLVNAVDQSSSTSAQLLSKIYSFTRTQSYPMFDMPTDVDLSNDVILVDMKGLQNDPKLQAIYTLLFSFLFSNKMYTIKDRRKILIRDEAWALMSNERARKYLVEDLRTARKAGFATISVSQFPTDYLRPDPADGRSIIGNMQVQILGKFEQTNIPEIASELGMEPSMASELENLGQVTVRQADGTYRRLYSRFMIKIGREYYILKNELHPFEYILYSSSRDDNAIIDYYLKTIRKFQDLEQVLWHIALKKHIGDEGLYKFLLDSGFVEAAKTVASGSRD